LVRFEKNAPPPFTDVRSYHTKTSETQNFGRYSGRPLMGRKKVWLQNVKALCAFRIQITCICGHPFHAQLPPPSHVRGCPHLLTLLPHLTYWIDDPLA